MNIQLDEGAFMPVRAHNTDAGADIKSPVDIVVPAGGSAVIKTGVHIELPKGCAGILISKSGLNVNHDITSTGLLDESYSGAVVVKLYNHGTEDYHIRRGDKITQLVVAPVHYVDLVQVDKIEAAENARGDNGFGSTGR